MNRFTKKAELMLKRAVEYSEGLGHTYIGTEHILMGLISDSESVSAKILLSHGVTADEIKKTVIEISGKGIPGKVNAEDMTPGATALIEKSASLATKYSQKLIGTEHILLALVMTNECVGARILELLRISLSELRNELITVAEGADINRRNTETKNEKNKMIHGCPTLSEYGRDLTSYAKSGRIDPIIGREKETDRVIQILSRRTKNNPCLIGEPGVGKTAVVEGLAQKIAFGEVPEMLRGRTIVTVDISAIIAGAKYRGEFEERLKNIMKECACNPDIILFIDELHTIIGAGAAEGAVDAANILKPALARGELQMIGATTISEYRKHIEKDSALERRFQAVTVDEPSAKDAERILFGLRAKYEEHHKLKISDSAIRAAVMLSRRYINDRFLPDKAIDLIDEAASGLKIDLFTVPPLLKELEGKLARLSCEKEKAVVSQQFERAARLRDEEKKIDAEYKKEKHDWERRALEKDLCVSSEDIADVVTQWTGIPVNKLVESESERLLSLSSRLKASVVGQDMAAEAVAGAIRRGRTGVSSPERPMGSFIFLGPTGVGKTQLTKALAEALFGSKDAVLRFDMSEYMEKHSVSKLIGSPPGYVGHDEGGLLTERIRRKPYSVVLFDEIEKADPDIFNLLLQVLDEGKLTDSRGREADFRNSVVIMTSNVGAKSISETGTIGFYSSIGNPEESENRKNEKNMRKELFRLFRPEFLNRVDEIIVFRHLNENDLRKITQMLLSEFSTRAEAMGFKLIIEDSAVVAISRAGYSPEYGARPIRRAITSMLEDRFALLLLNGTLRAGDTVRVAGKTDTDGKNTIELIREEL